MPARNASRGSRTGLAHSLMSRLTIATTASDAGKSMSVTAIAVSHGSACSAAPWRTTSHQTRAKVGRPIDSR